MLADLDTISTSALLTTYFALIFVLVLALGLWREHREQALRRLDVLIEALELRLKYLEDTGGDEAKALADELEALRARRRALTLYT